MSNYFQSLFNRDENDRSGSLFREFERVFDDFSQRSRAALPAWAPGALAPRADVCEADNELEVYVELPGVGKDDLDITVSGDVLNIRGEKKIERETEGREWHLVERSHGAFARTVPLGFEPDPNKIVALFDDGILTVRVPKPPEAAKKQAAKIKVTSR